MSKVVVDADAMTVYVDGEERYLTGTEFRVFCLLWEKRGKMVTHRELVEASCDFRDRDWYLDQLKIDRQLYSRSRNLIFRIRKALGDAVDIRSRRGVGFRLERTNIVEIPQPQPGWERRMVAGGHEIWSPPR